MRASSKSDRTSWQNYLANVGQLSISIANYGQGGFCKNTYNTIVQGAIHASAITVRERLAVIATPLLRPRDGRAGPGCELGSPIAALLSSATLIPSKYPRRVIAARQLVRRGKGLLTMVDVQFVGLPSLPPSGCALRLSIYKVWADQT